MSYYLRLDNKRNRTYLQIYDRHWDKDKKQSRSKSIQALGYLDELTTPDMPDPIAFYQEYCKKYNEDQKKLTSGDSRPKAFTSPIEKYAGTFLIESIMDELDIKKFVDILASVKKYQFDLYDMIKQLISARIIAPCSKSKTASSIFPMLWDSSSISEDQIYDGLNFIGENYNKYIELFNHCYEKNFKRNYDNVYFDCTNYYFEIDLPKEDKQKGPSKENRHCPIIGQALLLDSDLVPLAMQMYPGNESEKPYIRKLIEDMKSKYKVTGKTVQVADKGLNCARNIYAAVKESNDGYIFSKSIHGRGLSEVEKKWLLLENDRNKFTDYYDSDNNLKYRLKSCTDTFTYKFKETDENGNETVTEFEVKEKRLVSFNPALAEKQKAELLKLRDKATNYTTYKKLAKEEIGESAKYVKVISKDSKGKNIKPEIVIDEDKLNEDLKYCGYNLIVTSETNMKDNDIYAAYHNLWKIEESFRITKSYLDARPVYVQKKETIYGHFLICYLSLFLLRVLEIKCFENKINTYDIIEFMRDFRIVDIGNNTYINISHNQRVNAKIKSLIGSNILDALLFTRTEIENLFTKAMLIKS